VYIHLNVLIWKFHICYHRGISFIRFFALVKGLNDPLYSLCSFFFHISCYILISSITLTFIYITYIKKEGKSYSLAHKNLTCSLLSFPSVISLRTISKPTQNLNKLTNFNILLILVFIFYCWMDKSNCFS
jgi:hypothetical protein